MPVHSGHVGRAVVDTDYGRYLTQMLFKSRRTILRFISQSIGTVLLSIQSLMNEKPFCNEPGHESAPSEKIKVCHASDDSRTNGACHRRIMT